jgi:hypothetical protein
LGAVKISEPVAGKYVGLTPYPKTACSTYPASLMSLDYRHPVKFATPRKHEVAFAKMMLGKLSRSTWFDVSDVLNYNLGCPNILRHYNRNTKRGVFLSMKLSPKRAYLDRKAATMPHRQRPDFPRRRPFAELSWFRY